MLKSGRKTGEVAKQIGQIVDDVAGPLAKELGEMLRDELRPYRARRQVALLQKTQKMLSGANTKANAVPPKLLLSIVDNAGIEDDEELHTMWAALLAKAATEDRSVSPIFPEILRQMTPCDAAIMQAFEKHANAVVQERPYLGTEGFVIRLLAKEFVREEVVNSLQNLLHLSLIAVHTQQGIEPTAEGGTPVGELPYLHISPFGVRFLKACRPPGES